MEHLSKQIKIVDKKSANNDLNSLQADLEIFVLMYLSAHQVKLPLLGL